jgi:hypothetical protein
MITTKDTIAARTITADYLREFAIEWFATNGTMLPEPLLKPLPKLLVQEPLEVCKLSRALYAAGMATHVSLDARRATHIVMIPLDDDKSKRKTTRTPEQQYEAYQAAQVRRAARRQRNMLIAGTSGEGEL